MTPVRSPQGVMATPALVIDDDVVLSGGVPSSDEFGLLPSEVARVPASAEPE